MIIVTKLYCPGTETDPSYAAKCKEKLEYTLIECIRRQSEDSKVSSGVIKYPNDTVNWKRNFICTTTEDACTFNVFIHIVVYCRDPQEIKEVFKKGRSYFLNEIQKDKYLNREYKKGFPPRILVEFRDSELCVIM